MKKPSGHASGTTVVSVVVSFTAVATICLALRLWTRITIAHAAGWDDLVCSISLVFTIAFVVCICIQVHYGLGEHESALSPSDGISLGKAFWASILLYYLGLGLVKISICMQYMRVFGGIPSFRVACWTVIIILTIFLWYTVFITVFLCWPISHFWNPDIPGQCLPKLPIWFTNSSFSVLTDIAIAVMPAPVLKSLSLARRQRRMLMFVFGLGGCICIISVIRFHSLYAIAVSTDQSWDNPLAALLAVLECTVGIIASCLPILKGLFGKFFPRLFSIAPEVSREPPILTPLHDLSGPQQGKLHSTCSSEAMRPDSRKSNSGWRGRSRGRRSHVMDSCAEETTMVSGGGRGRGSRDLEKAEGITVTKIVEQVHSRLDDDGQEESSRDRLVPP